MPYISVNVLGFQILNQNALPPQHVEFNPFSTCPRNRKKLTCINPASRSTQKYAGFRANSVVGGTYSACVAIKNISWISAVLIAHSLETDPLKSKRCHYEPLETQIAVFFR